MYFQIENVLYILWIWANTAKISCVKNVQPDNLSYHEFYFYHKF